MLWLELSAMLGERKDRWQELCEQIIHETDPHKFTALIEEVNRILQERENHPRLVDPPPQK
jgi:hypothetical protein